MVQYDDFAETFGKSRRNLHWDEIDNAITDFLHDFSPTSGIIADIGCGNGRLLKHIVAHPQSDILKSIFSTYIGLDASSGLLDQARADTELQFFPSMNWREGDMRDMKKELSEYGLMDGIFFIASFHHLHTREERISVLQQAKKLLSATGKIVMINWHLMHTSQAQYQDSKIVEYPDGSADYEIKIGAHTRFYHSFSPEEYASLAEELGFHLHETFGERNSIAFWS